MTAPTLVEENPADLIIGDNVRLDPRLDKPFIASIKERGVLEPVVAYVEDDDSGQLVVLFGKRRVLAAVQAKRPTVPVMVVPKPTNGSDRVVDQLVENERREALTATETIAGYGQLAAFGLTAAQIAKRTATPRPHVEAALATAGSEAARAALEEYSTLTLDQAAAIAEFEDDPDAVTKLRTALKHGGYDHMVQRLRDHRAEAIERATHEQPYRDAGVSVVETPEYNSRTRNLDQLLHDGEEITPESHAQCPGHAVWVDWEYSDEDDDAPDTDDEDAADPEPPKVWEPHFVCTDPAGHGHSSRWGDHRKPASGTTTDEERQKASAERRDIVQGNKAWASAEKVRRDWLRAFLRGKAAPKSAAAFIAVSLGRTDHELRRGMEFGHKVAHDLLGLGDPPGYGRRSDAVGKAVETATDARSLMVALGLVLGGYEEATGKHSWRNADKGSTTARYLRYLEELGYELSDIELRACGAKPKKVNGDG